jgi:hypothetical protein
MDIHKEIAVKRQQLQEISDAIANQLEAMNKIDKPHLHKQYEEGKLSISGWKQKQTELIEQIMAYNKKYVPSPLLDERFNSKSDE